MLRNCILLLHNYMKYKTRVCTRAPSKGTVQRLKKANMPPSYSSPAGPGAGGGAVVSPNADRDTSFTSQSVVAKQPCVRVRDYCKFLMYCRMLYAVELPQTRELTENLKYNDDM